MRIHHAGLRALGAALSLVAVLPAIATAGEASPAPPNAGDLWRAFGASSSAADPSCLTLAFGTTATAGSIASGETDCFRFASRSGDQVRVRLIKTSGTLNQLAEVVRPNGTTLCGATTADDFTCELDTTGTHTILVRDFTGLNTGGYLISIQRLNNPVGCTTLTFGTTATPGSIATAGAMPCYRFTGAAGDWVRVRLIKTSGTLEPLAEVVRPNGTTVCGPTPGR